jgi:hypothetical protein
MANTLGGMILIGVAEDGDGKPITPIQGVSFENGLAERVLSICAANITPPVIPAVQVCSDPAGSRATIIIRVPHSHEAPHAISGNTRVYIRTGQRNDPDQLANLTRLTWLLRNREKSEQFREWIMSRAASRFDTMTSGGVPGTSASKEKHAQGGKSLPCLLTISMVPNYPTSDPLFLPEELDNLRRTIAVRDRMGTANRFPIQEPPATTRLVEDGVIMHVSGGSRLRTYHTHINMYGLYFYKQSLLYDLPLPTEETGNTAGHSVMRSVEIIERCYAMLATAAQFYEKINYFGPLRLSLKLENVLSWPLLISQTSDYGSHYQRYSADPEINVVEFCLSSELLSELDAMVYRLVRRVGWAFDWNLSREEIARLRNPA